ncbi:DUF5995 family protein [Aldersonia kunmingensis]|uniref:DUF5995 family protein n=1 Tax=Aldersonia kunmingensis TaxID=408066 RepID=UPI0008349482|nr:DUF5995 family protein [Aldersonia kunmingensis]
MHAANLNEVLAILRTIVDDAKSRQDPLGYFPAMYRQVTVAVKKGIDDGVFDDGPRMDRLDTAFANAYFKAFDAYQAGRRASRSWQYAFDGARSNRLIILQNLLLGINAHINLDLGVVTGKTFPGAAVVDLLDGDFNRINDILGGLVPRARAVVEQYSPNLHELTAATGASPELALNFSLVVARDEAKRTATLIAAMPDAIDDIAIETIDRRTKLIGRVVAEPPEPLALIVRHIRDDESTDVRAIITALDNL